MELISKLLHPACAAALCMILLCLCASFAQAVPRTDNDSIEKSCGTDNGSANNILIAYDTIHGSTAEVAEKIGNVLCSRGFQVDVRLAAKVESIDAYDGVIVASAIYKFTWLPDAKKFLEKFKDELAAKSTAVFIVCSGMSTDTPDTRAAIRKVFVNPTLKKYPAITPVAVGLFGGAVDFTKEQYTVFEKVVLRILGLILHFKDTADWRNWDVIEAWAAEVGDKMK